VRYSDTSSEKHSTITTYRYSVTYRPTCCFCNITSYEPASRRLVDAAASLKMRWNFALLSEAAETAVAAVNWQSVISGRWTSRSRISASQRGMPRTVRTELFLISSTQHVRPWRVLHVHHRAHMCCQNKQGLGPHESWNLQFLSWLSSY